MSDVMEMRVETEALVDEVREDQDLRDESTRDARRPGWYALVVILDAIAILAFITWVVIPRLS